MKQIHKRDRLGILFLLPSLVGASVFILLPYTNIIARSIGLYDANPAFTLSHYKEVLSNKAFQLAAKNTICFISISIPLLILISLFIAYCINTYIQKSNWIQTGVLLPMAIPISTVIILWNALFHEYGFLNKWLQFPSGRGIDWINSGYAMGILVFTFMWRNIGYAIVLWLAGISSVSSEVLEAGKIDGANSVQRFLYIICPELVYYFLCITILAIVNSFKIYRDAYLIAGDYPHESIYMLQHLFNNWFRDLQVANLSAGAVILLVFTVIVMFFVQKLCTKKGLEL